MERMQMYLARGQRARLGALSRSKGKPVAELVREAVDRYLAAEVAGAGEDDALFELIGADRGAETSATVSAGHHRVLASAARWEGEMGDASPLPPRPREGRSRGAAKVRLAAGVSRKRPRTKGGPAASEAMR